MKSDNKLFRNKYRIPTTRLSNWDYRSSVSYFVTICTRNRICYFGKIENGEMHLNDLGQFASECLHNISAYSQCATVINQIVMPNHVHAIIELKNETPEHIPNKFGQLLKNSLGSVVNHFKGRVTRYARANNIDYGWQSLYHDHIIRNGLEYQRIFNYVENNPRNWKLDTNNQ